jgi:hypothetical protein
MILGLSLDDPFARDQLGSVRRTRLEGHFRGFDQGFADMADDDPARSHSLWIEPKRLKQPTHDLDVGLRPLQAFLPLVL